MAHPPGDAVGQQAGQGSVNGRVRLAQDACQLRRVDERRPAEGVEQLSFGDCHVLRLQTWCHRLSLTRELSVWQGPGPMGVGA